MFKSFRIKLFVVFILLTFVISGGGIYFVYNLALDAQLEALRKTVLGIASTTALMIYGDEHKKIDPFNPILSEEHKKINGILHNVLKNNPDIRYVYTLSPTNDPNIYYFVADSDYFGKDRLSEQDLKEVAYDVSKFSELRDKSALSNPVATKELYEDNWGSFLSGYAPIKDKKGNSVAVVGIDMESSKISQFQRFIKVGTCLIFLLDIIISFILSLFISSSISLPLMKIAEHTKVIAEGNFKEKIEKISGKDELKTLADSFNEMIDRLDSLFFELHEAQAHLKDAYLDTIFRLAVAAEYKDKITSDHLRRVSAYSAIIAEKIGLPREDIDNIKYGSPMHDIGKIGIPDEILQKKGKLTDEEYKIIKEHTTIGFNILKGSDSPYLKAAAIISLTHHEKFDGSGYPEGLKGEEIHIYGRIVSLADVFDALTSERPYKKPIPMEETLNMIKNDSGRSFDPKIVEVFFTCLDELKQYIKYVEWKSI